VSATATNSVTTAPSGWTPAIALQLGRVSNLPTVWTNTLAGVVLAGGTLAFDVLSLLLLAMSLAYTGGMYLNDAFDRVIDAVERPLRPIPAGLVQARDVFIAGFAMLALAIVLTVFAASLADMSAVRSIGHSTAQVPSATAASVVLAACIVLYNCWHKGNALSPLIMGTCRLMVYITCALAVTGELPGVLLIGSAVTLSYLIGLTYTAKQEHPGRMNTLWPLLFLSVPGLYGIYHAGSTPLIWCLILTLTGWTLNCLRLILRRQPGDIPTAVVRLIAGISVIDALLIAIALAATSASVLNTITLSILCLAAFVATLLLQRQVPGT
jgi:4-hydroxybenzoate polyprenyltransferase